MEFLFICDAIQVNGFLKDCVLVTKHDDEAIYLDKNHKKYSLNIYYSEMLEIDIPVLQSYPLCKVTDLISLISKNEDLMMIAGISLSLVDRDFAKEKLNCVQLIELLENITNNSPTQRDKLKLCIYETELFDGTNQQFTVGKKISEIEEDFVFYSNIAKRAKKILKDIEDTSN